MYLGNRALLVLGAPAGHPLKVLHSLAFLIHVPPTPTPLSPDAEVHGVHHSHLSTRHCMSVTRLCRWWLWLWFLPFHSAICLLSWKASLEQPVCGEAAPSAGPRLHVPDRRPVQLGTWVRGQGRC